MTTTGETTRHLWTIRQGDPAWHWSGLFVGHVGRPIGRRSFWSSRHLFQLHVTPLHVARANTTWEYGLCLGKRTLYVLRHR